MAYKVIRYPNLATKGTIGFCLQYARRVFNIGAKYPYAWNAWTHSKQNKNRVFPNVPVFLWFSHKRLGVNVGHVVVRVPGKGYYSSPYKRGTNFAVLKSVTEVEQKYSSKYVGWSVDANGVSVAAYVRPATTAKRYHTVVKGDTVGAICKKYGISLARFKLLNPTIKNINLIYPGQRVRVK